MKNTTRALAALAAACLATLAMPTWLVAQSADAGASAEVLRHETPRVEIVFVLDTTGSMSGLIQGAKDTVWGIVNRVAAADPAPEISLGLVAYRDRGDAYVTRRTNLTTDLDAVYAELMSLQAGGGGDAPESVNLALYEAVTMMEWSKEPETFRTIFLVGDAPTHNYPDEKHHPEICALAMERDIAINTVQCGNDTATTTMWQAVARAGEGRYFHVPASGGVRVVATPFDAELARLSTQLDGTTLYYGAAPVQDAMRERKLMAARVSASAPASASAERAVFQASASGMTNFLGRNELVDAVQTKMVDLATIDRDDLPDEMKDLDLAAREAYVAEKASEREDLRKQINLLNAQREEFMKAENAKAATGDPAVSSFDRAVAEALREQGARKGLRFAD